MRARAHLLPIVGVLLLGTVLAGTSAAKEPRQKPKPNTTVVQTVGKWAYERLARAQKALSEEQTGAALAALDEMKARGDRLNGHERAMMWQTYGYVQSAQGKNAVAAESFEKALAEGELPPQAVENTRYNLAQLYMLSEKYDGAIEQLQLWFETAENPKAEAYILFAQAYLRAERPREALVQAQQGLAKAESPPESWLQLLLALHFELRQYREAIPVLQQLVQRFPKKAYWLQLAAVHSELGDYRQALGVMELAYEQGYLTEHRELVNLAQLCLHNGIPYEAASVLQKGMDAGIVEKNADTWRLLAESLLAARERERAAVPLGQAAELSDDGNLYLRLAQLAIDAERWPEARKALEAALAKGKLKESGTAYLLLGVTNVGEGRKAEAQRAFASALKYDKTKQAASEWLARLESEEEKNPPGQAQGIRSGDGQGTETIAN